MESSWGRESSWGWRVLGGGESALESRALGEGRVLRDDSIAYLFIYLPSIADLFNDSIADLVDVLFIYLPTSSSLSSIHPLISHPSSPFFHLSPLSLLTPQLSHLTPHQSHLSFNPPTAHPSHPSTLSSLIILYLTPYPQAFRRSYPSP